MKTGRNDPCPCGSGKKYKNAVVEYRKSKHQQLIIFLKIP